jgi:hypothetical protein
MTYTSISTLYRQRNHWDFWTPILGFGLTILNMPSSKAASMPIQGAILLTGVVGTSAVTYLMHINYTDQINNAGNM